MTAFISAVAAIVSATPLGEPWITHDDYPAQAIAQSLEGATFIKLIIAPSGKLEKCIVAASTGATILDETVCAQTMKRARFQPARDSQGNPTYGVEERLNNFWLPDVRKFTPLRARADFAIDVAAMPKGKKSPFEVKVYVAVDQEGALQGCAVPEAAVEAAFARVACQQLPMLWTPMPEVNGARQRISYVRSLRVEFQAPAAPPS